MKNYLLIFLICFSRQINAQNDQLNLEKYWKFRNTFKEHYIKIGPNVGESLPAGGIKPCTCVDDLDFPEDGTGWGETCYGEMTWGDGIIRHGHYLALLATEYRLLKNNNKDVTGVLNEIYFALGAINRLDYNAEEELGPIYSVNLIPSQNGFFLREDITEDFTDFWENEETKIRGVNSAHYYNQRASAGAPNGSTVFGNSYQNVPSNDQVSSLVLGLRLIDKLVDNVYVQPPSQEDGFFIISETEAITNRLVTYISDHNWQMIDVNGWPVANGGGDVALFSYALLEGASQILAPQPLSYNLEIKRRACGYGYLQHCITGFGSNDQMSQNEACDELSSHLLQNMQYNNLVNGDEAGSSNNQNTSVFQNWELNGDINADAVDLQNAWSNVIPNNYATIVSDYNDDGKLSFLPWPFNNLQWSEKDMPGSNNTIIFNYGVISGLWTNAQANSIAALSDNRCNELINAVLRDENPIMQKPYYQNFLNSLSVYGPYSLSGDGSDNNGPNFKARKYHGSGWGADYRWTNQANANNGEGHEGMFNAIDYMLFHNLYYLIFSDNLAEYSETYNCYCNPEISNPFSSLETSENLNLYSLGEMAQANNHLNQKLNFLPNCSPNVFTPVSNNVSGDFDIKPKFDNYSSLEIFTNKFQTENAIITSSGQVNIWTRLIVCNQKTLNLNAGGRIDIYAGELILNTGSVLDISGEVHVHSGAKLKILGPNAKIILRNGGKLILEDNTELLNNFGASIEYYNGANISSYGGTSEITHRGTIKLMNGGLFQIEQLGSTAGKFIIEGTPGFLAVAPADILLEGKSKDEPFITIKKNSKIKVFDYNLSPVYKIKTFTIRDCGVDFEEGAMIDIRQPFYNYHVKFKSSLPNAGIQTTDRTTFSYCDITNVPIMAPLNLEIHPKKIYIHHCDIKKDISYQNEETALVKISGMSYDIYQTNFHGKSLYCVKSDNLTFPSSVRESNFEPVSDNITTGVSDNSNVEIKFYRNNFNNLKLGILKNSGKLSLKCNNFSNNLEYNIVATNNCFVNLTSEDYAGYNSFGKTNISSISLENSKIYLQNGYNYFDNLSPMYITGTLNMPCVLNSDCSINAPKNQWGPSLAPPVYNKFQIIGSDNLAFMVSANLTFLKPECGFFDETVSGTLGNSSASLPTISTGFGNIKMDRAILLAMSKMQTNDTMGNDLDALSIFNDIFTSKPDKSNKYISYYLTLSLNMMKTAYQNAILSDQIHWESGEFDANTKMYIGALNYMTDADITKGNYKEQFSNELDKAHLYRILNYPIKSIEILENLEKCGINSEEQLELNYWKKQYLQDNLNFIFGTQLLDTLVNIDTTNFIPVEDINYTEFNFGSEIVEWDNVLYKECDGSSKFMQTSNVSKQSKLLVYPNPASVTLSFELIENTNSNIQLLEIYSIEGKQILSYTCNDEVSLVQISLKDFSSGKYLYKLIDSKGDLHNGKFDINR